MATQVEAPWGTNDAVVEWHQRKTMAEFFSSAYWTRGWIIQEATANNDTFFCYGPARYRIISWELLFNSLRGTRGRLEEPMNNFIFQTHQLYSCQSARDELGKLPAEKVRELRTEKSECPYMREWLLSIFMSNCWHTTDARDRVNATMSAMPLYLTLGFQPDYSRSTEDLFISATVHLLRTGRSWSHLQFLNPSGSPYLPSWTIDFTDARPRKNTADFDNSTVSLYRCYSFSLFSPGPHDRSANTNTSRFRADGKTPFRLRQMTRGILETAGLIVDKVVSVSSLFTTMLDCADEAKGVLRAWYRLLGWNKRYTRHSTTLNGRARKWEAFFRALCIGNIGDQRCDASHHAAASEALWDMVIHDRQRHPESMREEAQRLYEEMRWASMGARFIVTRKGRVGVAPREVAVGDSIGILASGDVPFILRKVKTEEVPGGHAYILLGGCYIDGKIRSLLVHMHS
jgi:hypothetical protein